MRLKWQIRLRYVAPSRFPFDYWNTVHCTTNEIPAEKMLNRNLINILYLLRPNVNVTVANKQAELSTYSGISRDTYFLYKSTCTCKILPL